MHDDILLAIEGPDGVGKGTVARLLQVELNKLTGVQWSRTADPSNGPTGKLLRLALKDETIDQRAMVYLFAADRLVEFPQVRASDGWDNYWLITERYMLSTVLYQSVSTPVSVIRALLLDPRLRKPAATIVLLADADVYRERLHRRGTSPERYESRAMIAMICGRYRRVAEGDYTGLPVLEDAEDRRAICGQIVGIDAGAQRSPEAVVDGIIHWLRTVQLVSFT